MVQGKKDSRRKVAWLDTDNEDSHDPKLWAGNVPRNVMGRLTPTKVRAIRQLYISGQFSQAELADMFGTTASTINHVVLRVTWKWL